MGFDRDGYNDAINFAIAVHCKQKRMNGDPYVLHLLRVSTTVLSIDMPKDFFLLRDRMGIAALLHDSVEDASENGFDPSIVLKQVRKEFGNFVTDLVLEVTQDLSLPSGLRRKKMVDECGHKSHHAQIIKLADRLDNVLELHSASDKTKERYMVETPIMLKNMKGACPELESKIQLALNLFAGRQK